MKTVKVTLGDFPSIEIHTLSDWHIGDKACDEDSIKEELEYIRNTENCFAICNGDLMNNATKTSVSDCYSEEIPPMEQLQRLVELLEPIKNKLLILTQGNHEARTYRADGIDLTALLAKQLGIYDRYVREGGILFLRFGKTSSKTHNRPVSYSLYCTHGSGGGKRIGGKANVLVDKASIVDTDIYVIGHHHTPFTTRQGYFRVDTLNSTVRKVEKLFVCTSAQLDYGGYGEKLGFAPTDNTPTEAILDGTKRKIKVILLYLNLIFKIFLSST